jgi:glycosyltransferase involved in cell wall biosynthesis
MKILHVIVGLNGGGAERMLMRLVESHAGSADYSHSIVSLTDLGELGLPIRAFGVDVQALQLTSALSFAPGLAKLRRIISSVKPTVVHTWMYHADLVGGLAAYAAGVGGIIWGVRTTDMIRGTSRATALIRRFCAILSRTIPRAIVCAAQAALESHVAIGYDRSKMIVIPNGFDLNVLTPDSRERGRIRDSCGWTDDDFVFGYIGRFNHYKDPENFVRAGAALCAEFPHARFLVVGRGLTSDKASLLAALGDRRLLDRFVFLGDRADIPACLSAMDGFCLSSRSEGFPNVVGEAMAVGLTCVVTDVGDARQIVDDTGIVVPPEDSRALANGMARVITMSPAEREERGARARRRIATEFSMTRARERFEALYKAVATNGVPSLD